MGAMGEFEYPDITMTDAIEIIEKIDSKSIQRLDVLANEIGHKGPKAYKGGGFRMKITALVRYSLLTGRPSELRLSDLAKTVIHHRTEDEKNEAIRKSLLTVPILAIIHSKLQGKVPSDFWVPLYDCTGDHAGIDQKLVKEHAESIRKLYADAVQYLKIVPETMSDKKEKPIEEDEDMESLSVQSDAITIKTAGINMTVAREDRNIEILKQILDTLKSSKEETGKES
jgi:hypothetical protein